MTTIATKKPPRLNFQRWLENLPTHYRNWRNRHVFKAYKTITKAMREDLGYAQSWHANIAMPIYDEAKQKLTIGECNDIADILMRHLFEVNPDPQPFKKP